MIRRTLLVLPALVGAIALPASPALAGEDGGDSAPAKLRVLQGCVFGDRAKASVSGDDIDRVDFWVAGKKMKTVTSPNAGGGYAFSMSCSRLSVGAHRASAVVKFESGSSPARQTLRYQITRAAQVSPR